MRTLVKTGFPYPLIWDSGQLDILTQGHTFAVEFRRLYNQEGQASGPPGVSAAQNVELRYDCQGRVSYTAIQILFPWLATDQSKILHWVHRVINRLLEVYRFTTEEFFCRCHAEERALAPRCLYRQRCRRPVSRHKSYTNLRVWHNYSTEGQHSCPGKDVAVQWEGASNL